MRRIQIFSIILFVLVAGLFGFYRFRNYFSVDSTAPMIAMDSDTIEVSCDATDEELLEGVTASDKVDGDVSDSLMIQTISDFTDTEAGKRTMTIVVFDSSSNIATATREIVYTDYESPRFSLDAPLRFATGTTDVITDLSASDKLDGDLTDQITVMGVDDVYVNQAGTYVVIFSVSNSGGDTVKLPVTLTFYDSAETVSYPEITLSDYLIYVQEGEEVDPWDYVEKITLDQISYVRGDGDVLYPQGSSEDTLGVSGITSSDVSITEDTEYISSGVYEIVYEITDDAARSGSVRLIVVTE